MVVFGKGGCIRESGCVRDSGKSGCIRVKAVVLGQSGCIRER